MTDKDTTPHAGLSGEERIKRATALIHEYTAESVDQLLARVEKQRGEFRVELEGLRAEQVAFSPGEGKWSIGEVSRHVSHSLRGVVSLSTHLRSGKRPPIEGDIKIGELDEPGELESLRDGIETGYDQTVTAMEALRGDCDMEITFPHPFFGELNCHQWLAFNVMHMDIHVSQIQRAKKSEAYPA